VNHREACGKLLGGSVSLVKRKLEEVAEDILEYLFPNGGYDDRWRDYIYALAERVLDDKDGSFFGVDEVLKCRK